MNLHTLFSRAAVACAALLSFFTLLFTACDNDIIQDYVPVKIYVSIHDAEGHDLLAPDADNGLRGQLTVTYGGQTYNVDREDSYFSQRNSRAYLASLMEPFIKHDDKGYNLVLGEWDGAGRYDNEQAVLNWPDGTHTTLSFTLKKNGWTNAKFFVDGQKNAGNEFDLIYPHK